MSESLTNPFLSLAMGEFSENVVTLALTELFRRNLVSDQRFREYILHQFSLKVREKDATKNWIQSIVDKCVVFNFSLINGDPITLSSIENAFLMCTDEVVDALCDSCILIKFEIEDILSIRDVLEKMVECFIIAVGRIHNYIFQESEKEKLRLALDTNLIDVFSNR